MAASSFFIPLTLTRRGRWSTLGAGQPLHGDGAVGYRGQVGMEQRLSADEVGDITKE